MDTMNFELGPPINEAVVAWLDRHAGQRELQLPVEIHGSSLRIQSSYLQAGPTRIALRLDTGALSIDLPMHLKPYCQAYPCRVWLQGTWGPLVPPAAGGKSGPVFAVRKVVGAADAQSVNVRLVR